MLSPANTNKPIVLFYHGNCWDGAAAAWVFSRQFSSTDVEYVECLHGKTVPNIYAITGKIVYIVDFSFDRSTTEAIKERAKEFVMLDHHQTALDRVGGIEGCHLDMNRSGAAMMFDYINERFHNGKLYMPLCLRYFQALDLYSKDQYDIDAFSAYLMQFDHPSVENVIKIANLFDQKKMLDAGHQINNVIGNFVNNIAKDAFTVKINGINVACVFGPRMISHHVAMEMSRLNNYGVGCCLTFGKDASVSVSLRVDNSSGKAPPDISTLTVSEYLGGGGHRYASGARMTLEFFNELYKNRF